MRDRPALLNVADRLEAISQFFGKLGAWLIIPLILIIVFDVISRKIPGLQTAILESPLYVFMSPTKLQEMEWHLHTALFLLALGFAYTMNAHVRVDLVRESLSTRKQAWIEFIGLAIFTIPYLVLLLYFGWTFVTQAFQSNEVSASMTGLGQRWIIKSFVLIGFGLVLCAAVSTLIRNGFYLFGPASLRDQIKMNMLAIEEPDHKEVARAHEELEKIASVDPTRKQ